MTRKQELDEALVSVTVGDTQDQGFRNVVAKLDPAYVIPTRKVCLVTKYEKPIHHCFLLLFGAVKALVKAKYEEEKQKASLTSDMWTSFNMDAFLALTLRSALLGVVYFPDKHTAANLASVQTSLMEEWGIGSEGTCLVADGAANMLVGGRTPRLHHAVCVAHTLKLMVKKCLDLTPVLSTIRTKARKLVGYLRSSTRAKVGSHLFMYVMTLFLHFKGSKWGSLNSS